MLARLKAKFERAVLENLPVSRDFVVLYVIHKFLQAGEKVWLTKIVDALGGKMTKSEVSHSIDNLSMYGILHSEYGDNLEGHSCMLYNIENGHTENVKWIMTKIDDFLNNI